MPPSYGVEIGPGMVPSKWERLSDLGVTLIPEASMSLVHSWSSFCTRAKSIIFVDGEWVMMIGQMGRREGTLKVCVMKEDESKGKLWPRLEIGEAKTLSLSLSPFFLSFFPSHRIMPSLPTPLPLSLSLSSNSLYIYYWVLIEEIVSRKYVTNIKIL